MLYNNDWHFEKAFRAKAEVEGQDRKISDSSRKGYSCPLGEKQFTSKQECTLKEKNVHLEKQILPLKC